MLSYTDARQKVIEVAGSIPRPFPRTLVEIEQAFGRILAEPVLADRDYPPFDRSTRDGFAVRAADAQTPGARLECIGELRAGGLINREKIRRQRARTLDCTAAGRADGRKDLGR